MNKDVNNIDQVEASTFSEVVFKQKEEILNQKICGSRQDKYQEFWKKFLVKA